jgi:hypothetical protein
VKLKEFSSLSYRLLGYHLPNRLTLRPMTFEEYLITKKINHKSFQQAEPRLYESWKVEFEQVHPNSFTVQKLYLINPLRRKYLLKPEEVKDEKAESISQPQSPATVAAVEDKLTVASTSSNVSIEEKTGTPEVKPAAQSTKAARPVFKPKPKIN